MTEEVTHILQKRTKQNINNPTVCKLASVSQQNNHFFNYTILIYSEQQNVLLTAPPI